MPALNLNQLPNDCFIWIKKVPLYGMNDYQIYFGDQEGELYQSKDGHKLGSITIGKASSRADSHVPAEHVWEVLSVMAQTGFGPLLYDLAMELAVKLENGKGMLKSDPSAMSDFAKKIWNYYYTSRPDVKWTQLDSPENELTPTFADNVHQDVSKKMYGKDWAKSPMSKGYSKNIELLNSPKIKIAESLLRIRNIK